MENDSICHIRYNMHQDGKSSNMAWCLRDIEGFAFENVDHALFNRINAGRLLICPKCLSAIERVIKRDRKIQEGETK